MQTRRRHWKQRFDPDARFVFTKRIRLGLDPEQPYANPGDPVPLDRLNLGRGRLRVWWEAGVIAMEGWEPPAVHRPQVDPKRLEPDTELTPEARAAMRDRVLAEAARLTDEQVERVLVGLEEDLEPTDEPQEGDLVLTENEATQDDSEDSPEESEEQEPSESPEDDKDGSA